jgi:hypothetical protein
LPQTIELLTDLEALTDTELGAVIARSNELLNERDERRKKEAIAQSKELLKAAGIKNLAIRRKGKREGK